MAGITFAVSTIFKSRDEQSKNFNRMGKNAKIFGKATSKAFKSASKSATSFKTIAKGILTAGAIQKALGGVSAGLQSVATDFLDFDNAILSASAKFKGLDLSTKAGIKTLNELKKTAREVGAATEFNASEAASGLDFLALAGFSAKQAMALLPGVTNLATVAQVDLATATDIASDSLGAFGLMTDDTVQLTKDFKRVQDVLAKTTATSNTNLTDLFEAIKGGAAAFTTAGQSMETFAALTGAMANAGLKGSKAGLVLKNMMNRLAKPSEKAAKMMEFLNFKVGDGKGGFADATVIIDRFNKATKDLTEVQKVQATATIFGTEIQTGMTLLFNEGGESLRSYRQMLLDSAGAAEKMAKVMRSSLINRLKSLGSAATEVGFQLFSAFSEQGAGAIEELTIFIRKIDLTPLIEGIKTTFTAMKTIFDFVVEFQDPIKILAGAFLAYQFAAGAAAVAQGAFNIAMNASPIGLVITAISLVVAGVVLLVQNWDTVKKAVLDFVDVIVKKLEPAFEAMMKVIKPILKDIDEFISPIIESIGGLVKVVGKSLVAAFEDAWKFVKPILEKIEKFIQPIIDGFMPLIDVIENKLIDAFVFMWRIVSPILDSIGSFIAPITSFISGILDSFGGGEGLQKSIIASINGVTAEIQAELDLREQRQKEQSEQRSANQTRLDSQAQQVNFSGNLNITGNSENATFTPTSPDARKINITNEMGMANP